MKKERVLLLFTDIDETLLPIDLKSLKKFITLIKKIQSRENVKVKLCPISGRQPIYVKGIMNFLNGLFENEDIPNFSEIGAGEQGSIILINTEPEKLIYLGSKEDASLKKDISHVVKNHPLSKYLLETPQNILINSFTLKNRYQEKMSPKKKLQLFTRIRKDLEYQFSEKITISQVLDCLEIAPKNLGKDVAIERIIQEYRKSFEICGITYSGDSENDLKAVKYLEKLSESKTPRVNVFLPSNAYDCLKPSSTLTTQKEKKQTNWLKQSNYQLFKGVLDLLNKEMQKGTLIQRETSNMNKDIFSEFEENRLDAQIFSPSFHKQA